MNNQKLELTWIGKEKTRKIEPRILLEDSEKSCGDKNTGNMLIHGDNLLALKALEQEYLGKIKCIYADPPYNINAANPYYNDYVPISDWLCLMKSRLEILYKLLSDKGTIFVQIDKELSAHLKLLMDEIFGSNLYVTTIAVRMSGTSGFKIEHSDKTIVKNVEYIHVYSKGLDIKPVYERARYDSHYSYILKENNNMMYMNSLIKEKEISDLVKKYQLKEKNDSLETLYEISNEFRQYVFDNKEKIGRTHTAPKIKREEIEYLNKNLLTQDMVLKREYGKNVYYMKKTSTNGFCQVIPISMKFNYVDNYDGYKLELSNILGDWWDGFYLDMGNVENEGNVEFKASKKPERLIFRILNMCTNKDDYVLDAFLGSGTTCAVAHKMGRKWIGIEMGEHCYTHCKPRIDRIVEGIDESGITKFVNWQGGGGYKFYELAPSLLVKDKFNNWVISENYNGELLTRAICKQEKFTYSPEECYWKQGKSSENDFIFVTTNYVSLEYLKAIEEEMKDEESLLICCKSYQEECENAYDRITVKKIPQSILKNCEYGVDDYSFNIKEILNMGEIEDEE